MTETPFKSLTFSLYRLSFEPSDEVVLTRFNKGITLRGAFGTVFRRLVCHDLRADCEKCMLHPSCPYSLIFAPRVPPEAQRLRLNRDIPRPFVIKPPLSSREVYEAGELLWFDLVVVGKAQDFLPYFIVTFEELGRQGIGVKRGRYRLAKLEAMNGNGAWEEVFDPHDRMVRPPQKPLTLSGLPEDRKDIGSGATIRFLTPVLLKERGRWVKPEFGPLMKRLRDRVNALSYFYCGEPVEMDFREFGERADRIRAVSDDLRWVEEKRFSRHRNLNHLLKGFLGEVEFRGDLEPFGPWLRLGEFLHVGKATAFGQGWYRVM